MNSQLLKIVVVVAAMVAVAVVVPNTNSFVILLATRALAFAILVMSVDILLGYAGLLSLGQAAYFGLAAYVSALMYLHVTQSFWLVFLTVMAVSYTHLTLPTIYSV